MKPGESFLTTTGSFPIFFAALTTVSTVSSDVLAPLMTSTNFISCGGLKKCMPQNLSGLWVLEASKVMLIEEVFEAVMASALAYFSVSIKRVLLTSSFSGTASIMRSASSTALLKSNVGQILPNVLSISSSEIFPLFTNFCRLLCIIFIPLSKNSCRTSLKLTSYSAA